MEFRYCASGPGCSNIANFCCTEVGVEFSQQSIGDIRISLATLYADVQCRVMKSKFLVYILTHSTPHALNHSPTHPLTKTCMEAGTLPKNSGDEFKS